MDIFKCIVTLLVGVALFLISLKMMSGGLRKSAGKGIRNLFSKTKDNRFTNFGIGAAATAVIQSSDATSVMVIGFISAGVLTLFQGACIVLGAYVGTTVTGMIVSLSSLSFSSYLCLFAIIGVSMGFSKKEIVKNIGELLGGFGLLFFALTTMTSSFGNAQNPTKLLTVLADVFSTIESLKISPLIFFLFGVAFTCITQSSSATSGIVIVLVGATVINLPSGFYLVLGATIGSLMPTLLATIGGNADVKRTGVICAIVKTVPAIIFLFITWVLEKPISDLFSSLFSTSQIAVAMFLFIYSLIVMFFQLFFVEKLIKIAEKLVVDKESIKRKQSLKFIDNRLLNAPKVAMHQLKLEVVHMLSLSYENFKNGFNEVLTQNFDLRKEVDEVEETIDYINSEITSYMISLSANVGESDERKIGGYFHMINDIERIGDHASNFQDMSLKMKEEDLMFSKTATSEFKQMYDVIIKMYEVVFDIFNNKQNISELSYLHELEDKTDKLKIQLSAAHFARISEKTCKIELSAYYSTFVSELERVADHLVNIGYAFVNPTGDEETKVVR